MRRPLVMFLVLATLLGLAPPSWAEGLMRRPASFQERRYATVVRQVLEFSCGSAALATILTHFLGRPTTERDVITILRRRYPSDEAWRGKQETGFSFEDIVFAAGRLGYAAQGATVDLAQLAQLSGPVIVHLDKGEWQHFSVLRAARDGFFYLSDPIAGQVTMLEDEFRREFTGSVLAIWRRGAGLRSGSPLQAVRDGLSLQRSLSSVTGAPHASTFEFLPPF